jgi:hypothetical protein
MTQARVLISLIAMTLTVGLAGCGSPPSSASAGSHSGHAAKTHAHHPKPLRVRGTISALGTDTLTVVTKSGTSHTFDLTSATKFLEKKSPVARTALKIGEVVIVVETRHGVTPTAKIIRMLVAPS